MPFSTLKKIFTKDSKTSPKRTIMIISDDKDLSKHLSMFLEHMGYEIKTAASMLAATKLLEKKIKFSALFVTAKLNSANGMTQVKELRNNQKYARIPVIFISDKVRDNDNTALKEKFPKSSLLATPLSTKNITAALAQALEIASNDKVKS